MEAIVYDTVINANRTSHSPCHERYVEKLVMSKATHNSQCELPYEKKKLCQTTKKTNESVYVRLVWDVPLLSRRVPRAVFVEHTSE